MAAWPLAADLLMDLEDDPGDARIVSEVRRGPPRVRRDSTTTVRRVRGEVSISGAERATLIAWGKTTLLEWSDSFTWEDPADDTTVTYRFATVPVPRLVRGGTPMNRKWRVPISLWILP